MKWRIKKIGKDEVREVDTDDNEPMEEERIEKSGFGWCMWLGILVVILGVLLLTVMVSTSRLEIKASNLDTRVNVLREANEKLQDQVDEKVLRGEGDEWICGLMVVTCEDGFLWLEADDAEAESEWHIRGAASYYDYKLSSGWSSEGQRVCAMRDVEQGLTVRATNLDNGKSVDCLVTDYGPSESIYPERVIDLSSHAFSQIGTLRQGVIENVKVEVIGNKFENEVNQIRVENGLNELLVSNCLRNAADTRAKEMIEFGYFEHKRPDGTKFNEGLECGTDYRGENLMKDLANDNRAVELWMDSPSHREIILGREYKKIGVVKVDEIMVMELSS